MQWLKNCIAAGSALNRRPVYIAAAQARLDAISPLALDAALQDVRSPRRREPRLPFCGALLEQGLLAAGQELRFERSRARNHRPRRPHTSNLMAACGWLTALKAPSTSSR